MASWHPQLSHFAIALLVVGVAFRAISLRGRPAFIGPAAFTLLALGTAATVLATYSGTAAHGPVERMPGARPAVEAHEEWGERTRNVFLIVLAIEAVALMMRRSPRARQASLASTAMGLVGLICLYEAGHYGGRLVYGYAGGVGTLSGDPADVERLLLAGLYQQAMVDRQAGRGAAAAALLTQAAQRFPSIIEVQLAAAESLLVDRKDPAAALGALRQVMPPASNRPLRIQHGMLTADALQAAGQRDGAAAVLQGLLTEYPNASNVRQRLDALRRDSAGRDVVPSRKTVSQRDDVARSLRTFALLQCINRQSNSSIRQFVNRQWVPSRLCARTIVMHAFESTRPA